MSPLIGHFYGDYHSSVFSERRFRLRWLEKKNRAVGIRFAKASRRETVSFAYSSRLHLMHIERWRNRLREYDSEIQTPLGFLLKFFVVYVLDEYLLARNGR